MCFSEQALPPIEPAIGGAVDGQRLILTGDDGTNLLAFEARSAGRPAEAGIVIAPDNRGLHHYYEELALRFAEAGVDAVAFDFFARTAGTKDRGADFDPRAHAALTTWAGLQADLRAAATRLRSGRVGAGDGDGPRTVFVVGFCFGGRIAFDAATLDLGLAGAIGFYGVPVGARNDIPAPADVADRMGCPILGLFGGADQAIPPAAVATFDAALSQAGVEHEIVTYPGAPHSFFDRTYEEHATASADAWARILDFIRRRTAA